jgi:hypothetical protein
MIPLALLFVALLAFAIGYAFGSSGPDRADD